MRRLLILACLGAVAAIPLSRATAATHSVNATRPICDFTGSSGKPYKKINIPTNRVRIYTKRAADIVPAPASGCPTSRLTPTAGGTAIVTNLVGEADAPTGDPVGTGKATIRLRKGQGQVCFSIAAQNITLPAAAAHIHHGSAGTPGPVVIPLQAPDASGNASGCVAAARVLVSQILAAGSDFYVNVHTSDFPGGAIRGQLGGTPSDLGSTVTVQMAGSQECNASGTCGVGDGDGTGTAILRLRPADGQVCFKLTAQNIKLPSVGAHIHQAARGVNGAIVVPFTAPDANGHAGGCTAVPRATIDAIIANPAGFYANVHTPDFPGGAIRGQLG